MLLIYFLIVFVAISSPRFSNTCVRAKISVRAIKGGRVTMEDEYFVSKGGRFAAVFDGHGGGGVSQLLRNKLYEWVVLYLKQKHWEEDDDEDNSIMMVDPSTVTAAAAATSPASNNTATAVTNMDIDSGISDKVPSISSYVAALRMAFSKAEADVLKKDALKYQGSTAVAVLLHESHDDGGGNGGNGGGVAGHQRTLVSANVGDSRAILSRRGRAIDLTRDHKPNEERKSSSFLLLESTGTVRSPHSSHLLFISTPQGKRLAFWPWAKRLNGTVLARFIVFAT
jgi:serine/threonine protein phosphatase PrpC